MPLDEGSMKRARAVRRRGLCPSIYDNVERLSAGGEAVLAEGPNGGSDLNDDGGVVSLAMYEKMEPVPVSELASAASEPSECDIPADAKTTTCPPDSTTATATATEQREIAVPASNGVIAVSMYEKIEPVPLSELASTTTATTTTTSTTKTTTTTTKTTSTINVTALAMYDAMEPVPVSELASAKPAVPKPTTTPKTAPAKPTTPKSATTARPAKPKTPAAPTKPATASTEKLVRKVAPVKKRTPAPQSKSKSKSKSKATIATATIATATATVEAADAAAADAADAADPADFVAKETCKSVSPTDARQVSEGKSAREDYANEACNAEPVYLDIVVGQNANNNNNNNSGKNSSCATAPASAGLVLNEDTYVELGLPSDGPDSSLAFEVDMYEVPENVSLHMAEKAREVQHVAVALEKDEELDQAPCVEGDDEVDHVDVSTGVHYTVVFGYEPIMDDELCLTPGDTVVVLKDEDNADMCYGFSLSNEDELGWFPRKHLERIEF